MHFSKNFVGGAKLIFCQCLRLLNRVSFATSRGDTKKPVRISRPDLWIICQSCSVFSHTSVWFRKSQFWYLTFLRCCCRCWCSGCCCSSCCWWCSSCCSCCCWCCWRYEKVLTTEAFFQGHFFKAHEATYQRVRIKINKMIFFLSFFCFTRVSSWRTFHRTGAGNLNWKNVFREADKAGPSWAWVEDRGRPWWPRRTPSWGPSASARSTPDTWQHRRLWPSTDPGKQIVKPLWARALRN